MQQNLNSLMKPPAIVQEEHKPGKIWHFNVATLLLHFEWHEQSKRLFLVHDQAQPVIGELIGENIMDHGSAWNGVLMFCRGYKAARFELDPTKERRAIGVIKEERPCS
jgi:hypothetical protein